MRARASALNYDLLAVDLDGTLLDSSGRVSDRNIRALTRARDAGLRVTVCTGRGLIECAHILEKIAQADPVVVAGGSILACPRTRTTMHRFALNEAMVRRAVDRLLGHRHPVMVLKDPAEAGYDYLMVQGAERHALDPVTVWWFEQLKVRVRYAASIDEDEHPGHTVRVGVCGLSGAMRQIHGDMSAAFGEHATMHHFPAVIGPQHAGRLPEGESLHILEVFAREASKWSAIRWLARRHGIAEARIAAIGDEINDVPMIKGAGLGVAMGNAVGAVRDAAQRRTLSNDDHGVAHAVERILDGEW